MIWEELVLGLVLFSVVVILLILTKVNRAVRLLNNRINLQSSVIKQLRKAQEGGDLESADPNALMKEILVKEFGGGDLGSADPDALMKEILDKEFG